MSDLVEATSKYTLWKLLSEYKIVIPIIQRDYAQGRSSYNATLIREELLDCIYEALVNNTPIDFDFVYGTVVGDKLYPLDGQQRLTTFYLLHWYLAQKENRMEDARAILSKFSYQTRVSSREFCSLLMDVQYVPEQDKLVSEFIKNENGYFRRWDLDPTISHMLTMLDCIHKKFFDMEDMFDALIDEELLTFNYLPMENYALTDDLYIKMNARGKALSVFENFKAKFIQHLKRNSLPYEYFEKNIDGRWTDLLWDYRDYYDNTIDEQFMNLFCYITEMLFLETSKPREGDSPFRADRIHDLVNFYMDEATVLSLYKYLDLWENQKEISGYLSSVFSRENEEDKVRLFEGKVDIMSSIINGDNVSLSNKLVLFAIMKRLAMLGKDCDLDSLKDYTRLIRNYLLNSRQFKKNNCTYSSDVRFGRNGIPIMQHYIDALYNVTDNVYQALLDKKFGPLNTEILANEREKAQIIVDNPDSKHVIQQIEDLSIFKGCIFNVIPYLNEYDDDSLADNLKLLENYSDINLIQALLSIKDYGIQIGNSFLGERCFYGNPKDMYPIFSYNGGNSYKEFISKFIDLYESVESDSVSDSLNEICKDNLTSMSNNDWRKTLVKYRSTLEQDNAYIDREFVVLALEECDNGTIQPHRINGFTMNGYHVIPEYIEVKKQLGSLCNGFILSNGGDEENQGAITLSISHDIKVKFTKENPYTVFSWAKDEKWVNSVVNKFNEMDPATLDKVEKYVKLCRMLADESQKKQKKA